MISWIYSNDQNKFFSGLIGKTIIEIRGARRGSNHISFLFNDGSAMKMSHLQDCYESVEVEDICGDINDLIGSPLLGAEVVNNASKTPRERYDESYTWTFYKFRTVKGYVDIRWYGTSNGYYSEDVDIQWYYPDFPDNWEDVFE